LGVMSVNDKTERLNHSRHLPLADPDQMGGSNSNCLQKKRA
jgi:hypothetical protein